MNSIVQENVFQDDDEIAIFEVLFDFLKKELDKILIFNQSRKKNVDVIKKRKKLLLLLLNLNDEDLINDLAENGVNLVFIQIVLNCYESLNVKDSLNDLACSIRYELWS